MSVSDARPQMARPLGLPRRNLAGFSGAGYERGRNSLWQISWLLISGLVIVRWWCPPRLRVALLRLFGATIGDNVLIRHRVRIHWPWKLVVGDNSWIGEDVWILNLEPVLIGSDVCISQGVMLCTGSHDRTSQTFEFDNAPIVVEDGAWIAARATILRGSRIGHDSVVGATALVSGSLPAGTLLRAPRAKRPELSQDRDQT
ncbi:putative colanic acid biosynthesis acetyltransferase [Cryobacterium sp. TMT3-29-2]|uniref:putative colanic acid biosynthesis acetyltransferase n=1 Tax=Cryobacterium sp. TMT3-29-2 TaxID=2555867 RepID=UPI001F543469|nr:putative colanic acid biosynthesis acetyltransferase [Cryobacterium sp. TMT3-29-2]